jgi:hypothetical protein
LNFRCPIKITNATFFGGRAPLAERFVFFKQHKNHVIILVPCSMFHVRSKDTTLKIRPRENRRFPGRVRTRIPRFNSTSHEFNAAREGYAWVKSSKPEGQTKGWFRPVSTRFELLVPCSKSPCVARKVAMAQEAADIFKGPSLITYEDLLISSKFFYTEGSEDSSTLFPDETKENVSGERDSTRAQRCTGALADTSCADAARSQKQSLLDVDVGLEAACGDAAFLVGLLSR